MTGQVVKQESTATKATAPGRLPRDSNTVQTRYSMEDVLKQFKEVLSRMRLDNKVQMFYDEQTNRVVIQVLDGQKETVVKQIPSDELLSFLRKFDQYIGLVIDGRI